MTSKEPQTLGPYEISETISKGGTGSLYRAVETSSGRAVTLKVLPPRFRRDKERVERFERECEELAKLDHPNVLRLVGHGEDEEQLFLVMEDLSGTPLDVVLKTRRLSLYEALTVAKALCKGLAAAHGKDLRHRDLTPRNIFVSDDLSLVKLADFGVSRMEEKPNLMSTLSTGDLTMGSLNYLAPEQMKSRSEADARADIYSLGVVFYEMLTGRVPSGRFNLPSQVNPEIPAAVDPVVLKCLARDPADRYPTARSLLGDLEKLEHNLRLGLVQELQGFSKSTSRILQSSTGVFFRHRRLALLLGGAFLLAVLALAGLYVLLGGSDDSTETVPSAPVTAPATPTETTPVAPNLPEEAQKPPPAMPPPPSPPPPQPPPSP